MQNDIEVRRADILARQLPGLKFNTYEAKLSACGRTVTSLKSADNGLQMIEVWDTGKGSICRVSFSVGEEVKAFLQLRYGDKNCLFISVKSRERGGSCEVRGYTISKNGEICDQCLTIKLELATDIATGLYMGSDALYVEMSGKCLYRTKVMDIMLNNDANSILDDVECRITDNSHVYLLGGPAKDVFSVNELQNQSETWR